MPNSNTASTEAAVHNASLAVADKIDGLTHSLSAANQQMRESLHAASDKTLGYIRKEPVKSVLIAAATGATLMLLTKIFSPSPRRLR